MRPKLGAIGRAVDEYSAAAFTPRRVLAGEGMLTPKKPVRIWDDANRRWRTLLPGRDRVAPEHEAYLARPEWFRPADPQDARTAAEHRQRLERLRHRLEANPPPGIQPDRAPAQRSAPAWPRSRYTLPPCRGRSWQLP